MAGKRLKRTVHPLRLLIIEDDVDQRELIRETLENHFGPGTVVGVDSRKEALAQDLHSFDLILTDYNLPDGSGMDLLKEVRERCETPVVMVTGENVGQIAAEAIANGASDYVVKFGDYLFTIPLVIQKNLTSARVKREMQELQKQLQEKNNQLEQAIKQVERMAATDHLTGLYNRRHFGRVIEQMFAEAQRYDQDLACCMIDLDSYKQLNDTFGHQVGDQLLMLAGRVIQANLRKMDVAARYGGDEFVVLLPHQGAHEAALVASRIKEDFRVASTSILRRDAGVNMSIGVESLRSGSPHCADHLLAGADAALYRAKDEGRNRVVLASAENASRIQLQPTPS